MQGAVSDSTLKGHLGALANQFTGVQAIHGLLIEGLKDDSLELEVLQDTLGKTGLMIGNQKASAEKVFGAIQSMSSISGFQSASESLRERLVNGYHGEPSALSAMRTRLDGEFKKLEQLQEKLTALVRLSGDDIEVETGSLDADGLDAEAGRQVAIDYIISQFPEGSPDLRSTLEALPSGELEKIEAAMINAQTLQDKNALLAEIAGRNRNS
jgi:hypothetical protein